MLDVLLSTLRDKRTSSQEFRQATGKLSSWLAWQASSFIKKETIPITTPLAESQGAVFNQKLVIVPILRSGLALLPAFSEFFPAASVGFIGIRRDEKAEPHVYYTHFPTLTTEDLIFVLEPMIATAGSCMATIKALIEQGAAESQILLVSIIASPEGAQAVYSHYPKVQFLSAHVDESLDHNKYIVPGLGDFGDRYFGTPLIEV
jgi:uracil phosphoribosyltransferase